MFAMMVAYSTPKTAPAKQAIPPADEEPAKITEVARPVPRLVASNPPAVSIIEFAAGTLERARGAEVEFDEFYLAYWDRCKALDGRTISPTRPPYRPTNSAASVGSRFSAAARSGSLWAFGSRPPARNGRGSGQ